MNEERSNLNLQEQFQELADMLEVFLDSDQFNRIVSKFRRYVEYKSEPGKIFELLKIVSEDGNDYAICKHEDTGRIIYLNINRIKFIN
jgi:hypothetical protein